MVTMVGLDSDFRDVVKSLIELDYDAIEAYRVAAERVENQQVKTQLAQFMNDHQRHTVELSGLLSAVGEKAPTGPDMKQILTKGKVYMADLFGDRAILMAMKTNEEDTNTAYERAFNHKGITPEAREIIERGYADERRHRAWIMDTIPQYPKIPEAAA